MTLIKELVSEDHHPPRSPPPPFLHLLLKQLTLEIILHYPVLGSEIVGSVKLRKHEHKNKAGGGALPFFRHRPLFPDYTLLFLCAFHLRVIHTI